MSEHSSHLPEYLHVPAQPEHPSTQSPVHVLIQVKLHVPVQDCEQDALQ